jgi:3-oxoacid CoA-transferase A subunit
LAREKVYSSPETALADVFEEAVVLIGGFAGCGLPQSLLRALHDKGVAGLTCIFSPGFYPDSSTSFEITQLVSNGQVRKLVSSLPFPPGKGGPVEERWRAGGLEIEIVPQGTLAERLRAGGAGLGGVFLPTGARTRFQEGKERRRFAEQECLLEMPLKADFALCRAGTADTLGNLVYQGTGRNWGPAMAMAATISIAEVDQICEPGRLDPETVITPGIFVNRIVQATRE